MGHHCRDLKSQTNKPGQGNMEKQELEWRSWQRPTRGCLYRLGLSSLCPIATIMPKFPGIVVYLPTSSNPTVVVVRCPQPWMWVKGNTKIEQKNLFPTAPTSWSIQKILICLLVPMCKYLLGTEGEAIQKEEKVVREWWGENCVVRRLKCQMCRRCSQLGRWARTWCPKNVHTGAS